MKSKPKILSRKIIARSRLFTIEAVNLRFANGAHAEFERLTTGGGGIVIVIAIDGGGNMLMIREYAAGTDQYELGFVKGRIDPGESPRAAALRELQEEIGFGAKQFKFLRCVDSAPAYTDFVSHIFIATDLYPHKLRGDEVEPPQKVEWPLAKLTELYSHPQVNDARVLLSLTLLEKEIAHK